MIGKHGPGNGQTYHVLMSHLHWDQLMGFPFFTPAFIPGNRIVIYSCHDDAEASLRRQNQAPNFPVYFSVLAAKIEFRKLKAAKRIQMGILPKAAEVFPDEQRFSKAAISEPARTVGEDLYDFFLLDDKRLFLLGLGLITSRQ